MDGVEVSLVLAARFPAVRAVVFTSWGGDDYRVARMMAAGCVGYLEKEAAPVRVEEVLREAFRASGAGASASVARGF